MYTDKHIRFLQYMLRVGCKPLDQSLEECQIITGDDEFNINKFNNFISEINENITKDSLKLLSTVCEVTGQENLLLINTKHDEIFKYQNSYSPIELEYFQSIMHEIVISEEKQLPQIFCLNLSSSLTAKLSIPNAEILIEKWCNGGYLVNKNGFIFLGPRSILEYTSHFRQNCNDYIHICNLCSEIVVNGSICVSCNTKLHLHCLTKFLKNQNKCPKCKKKWNVGDGDQGDDDDGQETDVSIHEAATDIDEIEETVPSKKAKRLRKRK